MIIAHTGLHSTDLMDFFGELFGLKCFTTFMEAGNGLSKIPLTSCAAH